jgi:hypothetical protein
MNIENLDELTAVTDELMKARRLLDEAGEAVVAGEKDLLWYRLRDLALLADTLAARVMDVEPRLREH